MKFAALISLFTVLTCSGYAQTDTGNIPEPVSKPRLRISLLVCEPGPDVWETFGHACLRVVDSAKTDAERDKIYNYGFYEASPDNPLIKQALTGRVRDLLDTITYAELMYEYNIKERGIEELVFNLTDSQKLLVHAFLKNNLRRENRYYEFDTFYDNCSTRIVDLFEKIFGNKFVTARTLPASSRITFRDVTATKLCPEQHKYWFGLGINLTYASRTDRIMNSREAMFLPPFLMEGLDNATIDGRKLGSEKLTIRRNEFKWDDVSNEPFIIILLISALTITCLIVPRFAAMAKVLSYLILIVTGAVGCGLLYLCTIDGEPAFKENYNLLWALPANLIVPFLSRSAKAKYAIVAMCLIGIALILHVLRVQVMPVLEIGSLLLALLFVFGIMYRSRLLR
ncbi:MAG: DUF4105 domain-containing protein [Bacteroidota bacterium]